MQLKKLKMKSNKVTIPSYYCIKDNHIHHLIQAIWYKWFHH